MVSDGGGALFIFHSSRKPVHVDNLNPHMTSSITKPKWHNHFSVTPYITCSSKAIWPAVCKAISEGKFSIHNNIANTVWCCCFDFFCNLLYGLSFPLYLLYTCNIHLNTYMLHNTQLHNTQLHHLCGLQFTGHHGNSSKV